MTKKRPLWCISLVIITIIWLPAEMIYSQTSENYTITRYVLDSGRGESWSRNYTLCHSIDRHFLGITNLVNNQYMDITGFYAGCPTSSIPPPPPPTETPSPVVPEPATFFLIITGLVGLFIFMKRNLRLKGAK